MKLAQYSPSLHFEQQFFDDLIRKRNQYLLKGLRGRLSQADDIIVPWGVDHMPGIADEIQTDGFRLGESEEYTVIRFRSIGKRLKAAGT